MPAGVQFRRRDNDLEGLALSLPRALRTLANGAVVTEDRHHPPAKLGAVAATCERRRSHRPCHPRAKGAGTSGLRGTVSVLRDRRWAGRWPL